MQGDPLPMATALLLNVRNEGGKISLSLGFLTETFYGQCSLVTGGRLVTLKQRLLPWLEYAVTLLHRI